MHLQTIAGPRREASSIRRSSPARFKWVHATGNTSKNTMLSAIQPPLMHFHVNAGLVLALYLHLDCPSLGIGSRLKSLQGVLQLETVCYQL
jgi:hypothetical protein